MLYTCLLDNVIAYKTRIKDFPMLSASLLWGNALSSCRPKTFTLFTKVVKSELPVIIPDVTKPSFWLCSKIWRAHDSKLVQIYAHLIYRNNDPTKSQFCTWYDSTYVMTCAKFWPDRIIIFHATWMFPRVQSWAHKPDVKWGLLKLRSYFREQIFRHGKSKC